MKPTNAKKCWIHKETKELTIAKPAILSKFYACDSMLEGKTLLSLMRNVEKPHTIMLHPTITIFNFQSDELLKDFGKLNKWKPDFLITREVADGVTKQCIVEVKGRVLHPFPYQYALCRRFHPNVPIIVVRTESGIPTAMGQVKKVLANAVGIQD